MKRFKSTRHLQYFVSIHDPIANLFHFPRHDLSACEYRALRTDAMTAWNDVANLDYLHLLRPSHRPLLLSLEQAHRSALAHHVYRLRGWPTRFDQRIGYYVFLDRIISELKYKFNQKYGFV